MTNLNTEQIKTECMMVSPLIHEVSFCSCVDKCARPTVYIKHQGKRFYEHHVIILSSEGMFCNSNGYHPIEVHDAMNEAVKIARQHLGI